MTQTLTRGIDSSGRAIITTPLMGRWLDAVLARLDFTPTIVQGSFMAQLGGGASDSAGYHDGGGCIDFRTWDLTPAQIDTLIRVLRQHGAAAWRRDQTHGGMDPHVHIVCGWDYALASGAAWQWQQYLAGRDGLASSGTDYEWRPTPLVTTPIIPQEEDMAYLDWPEKDREALARDVAKALLQTDLTPKDDDGKSTVRRAFYKILNGK